MWEEPDSLRYFPSEPLVRWARTLPNQSRVLDIGCGNGANLVALASLGHAAVGIDGSPAALKLAEAWLLKLGLRAELKHELATEFEGQFDAICETECFQHLSEDAQHLAHERVAAALPPAGRFFSMHLIAGWDRYPELEFAMPVAIDRLYGQIEREVITSSRGTAHLATSAYR